MPFVSRLRQIRWTPSGQEPAFDTLGISTGNEIQPPASSIAAMIREMDLPVLATPSAALREATLLLQIASEVEHEFLLQYLYASYSLDPSKGPIVSGVQRQIVSVARQEMAHLVTVQNLLLALNQPFDINRENFPTHPDLYPFPAALEPVTSTTIAKYLTAEAPALNSITDPADRAIAVAAATQAAQSVPNLHRVGAIYAVLYWLLQEGDQAEGPWLLDRATIDALITKYGSGFHIKNADFADPAKIANFAANENEWGAFDSMHIDPVFPRLSALTAIKNISFQGEGPEESPGMPSHFRVFLGIYRDSLPNFPAGAVRNIPTNPCVVPAGVPPAGASNEISEPVTAAWASLLNLRYRILLLDILTALSLDRSSAPDAALRQSIISDWAVAFEMVSFIAPLAQGLTTKPLAATPANPQFAAAPFEFGDALPNTPCGLWKEQLTQLQRSAALVNTLLRTPGLSPSDSQLLNDISAFDAQRQPIINSRLQQHCT